MELAEGAGKRLLEANMKGEMGKGRVEERERRGLGSRSEGVVKGGDRGREEGGGGERQRERQRENIKRLNT